MAEALLRRHLDAVGAADVGVSSAGLYAGGHSATDHGQATMAARGLDLSSHRSRQLERGLVDAADLVLGMTREHVREVAVLDPSALPRTFTLKELVRDATAVGPRHPDEPFSEWLGRLGARRRLDSLQGVGHDDVYDVADPIGRGRADYEATAAELDHLLAVLVELVWPTTHTGQERRA